MEFLWISLLLAIVSVSAIPKPDDKHNPLEHDSAHKSHFDGEQHNTQYDHEAFLGQDEAKQFDTLSPEESKRRLGLIYDKIDDNQDGFIDLSELKKWIQFTQRRYIDEDVGRMWKQHNPDNEDSLKWEVYKQNVYGFLDELAPEELEREEHGISYKRMLTRDRRRWGVADQDNDDRLTREEFTAFLHPEDHPTMRDIVIIETIEDIDKNNDGKVSEAEYIGDMYRTSDTDEEEPEWVMQERHVFSNFRDVDRDGFMDKEEVRSWIVPKDYDHAESEAKHLLFEADENEDEKLTKEEVLEKYDLFVGSQATDFGEALARHDEF